MRQWIARRRPAGEDAAGPRGDRRTLPRDVAGADRLAVPGVAACGPAGGGRRGVDSAVGPARLRAAAGEVPRPAAQGRLRLHGRSSRTTGRTRPSGSRTRRPSPASPTGWNCPTRTWRSTSCRCRGASTTRRANAASARRRSSPRTFPAPATTGTSWARIAIAPSSYVWFFWSWIIQFPVEAAVDPQAAGAEVRGLGPDQVRGSRFPARKAGQDNAICVERVVLVRADP